MRVFFDPATVFFPLVAAAFLLVLRVVVPFARFVVVVVRFPTAALPLAVLPAATVVVVLRVEEFTVLAFVTDVLCLTDTVRLTVRLGR